MTASQILTFYSVQHEKHAPTVEFLHGQLVPYFEVPRRIDVLCEGLRSAGLIDLQEPDLQITKADIGRVHLPEMVDYLERQSQHVQDIIREDMHMYALEHLLMGDEYFYESIFPTRFMRARATTEEAPDNRGYFIFDSTSPVGKGTWDAILHSANLAFVGAQAVLNGEHHAYAMCRPPGHHAGSNFAGGYCYFNNAAIAARVLQQMGRVAILDIDYHHGNGTQAIFWNDPDVLFISIHADPTIDYPFYSGYTDEIGGDDAEGTTVNLPLAHGSGEPEYFAALETAYEHIRAFSPAALVVSLGFDTYKDDPMARFELEIDSYHKIGRGIRALGLPTLYVQEGGYYVDALGEMAVSFFQGVLEG